MKSVYLAYTPYHLMLSAVIATAIDYNEEKTLIIFKDFVNPEVFASVLSKWKLNPFNKILLMNGTYDAKRYHRRFERIINPNSELSVIRRNVTYVKRYVKSDYNINKIFTFHDGRAESQIAEHINHKRGGTNIYVEDGAAVYSNYVLPKPSPIGNLFYKIYFGNWFQYIRFQGDYKYTHNIMVLRPDLVRPELKSKKIDKIPVEILSILKTGGFVSNLLKRYGSPKISKPDILMILPYFGFLIENDIFEQYMALMENILNLARNKRVYFKYHPREKVRYLNDLVKNTHVIEIPQGLPLEVLYLHLLNNPPKVIVGDISTSLILASIIYERKPTIISTLQILELKKYPYLEEVFKRLGILMPNTIKELMEIMNGL